MAEHRKALAILQKLAQDNPKEPSYRYEAADAENGLSAGLRRRGHAEARDHAERAVAVCEALVKEDPKNPSYRARLAINYLGRGLVRRAWATSRARRRISGWR